MRVLIGSKERSIAVDPKRRVEPVRCFSAFTNSPNDLADWLQSLGVELVATEANSQLPKLRLHLSMMSKRTLERPH